MELSKTLEKTEGMFKKAAYYIEKSIPKKTIDHAKIIDDALKSSEYFVDHSLKSGDLKDLTEDLIGSQPPVTETPVVEAEPLTPVQEVEPQETH